LRDRIMQKAFDMMNVHGVRFTMAELARELAVSKSTIYQYFDAKDALISAIANAIIADLVQQEEVIIANPGLSFLEKFEALLTVYPMLFGPVNDRLIDDFKRYLPQEWAKMDLYKQHRWQKIETLIRAKIDFEELPPINLAILQRVYSVVMDGLIDYQFLLQNNLTFHDAMAAFAELFTFGLTGKRKLE